MPNNEETRLKRDVLFNGYKGFVDSIIISSIDVGMYKIDISKTSVDSDNSLVNIAIFDTKYTNCSEEKIKRDFAINNFFGFFYHVMLPNTVAEELLDDIREDFGSYHHILYSAVNENNMVQTMQNTKFALCIKLNNIEELNKAKRFNFEINKQENRNPKKVLKLN